MRTPTPTTVDQITAEKMKISERLARLDADREKIATQLADLETAERVLTRVSKAPTWSATTIGFGCRSKGRDYGREAAAGRQGQPQSSGETQRPEPRLGRACSCHGHRQNPTRTLRGVPQRSPEPCRHRGAAPSPRGADPGARRETVCDTLIPDHKEPGCASLWILRQGPMVRFPFAPGKSRPNTDGDCRPRVLFDRYQFIQKTFPGAHGNW